MSAESEEIAPSGKIEVESDLASPREGAKEGKGGNDGKEKDKSKRRSKKPQNEETESASTSDAHPFSNETPARPKGRDDDVATDLSTIPETATPAALKTPMPKSANKYAMRPDTSENHGGDMSVAVSIQDSIQSPDSGLGKCLTAGLVLVLVTMLLFLVGGLVAGGGQEEKRLKNETSTNPVFASGDASHGFFSAGTVSVGVFSAGSSLSLGLFSLGFVSIGFVSFGFFSVGVVSGGVFSVGLLSTGHIALGLFAWGSYAFFKQRGYSMYRTKPVDVGYLRVPMQGQDTQTTMKQIDVLST